MVKDTFTHGDVLKVIPEIKAITLIKWCERGIIKPVYEPPTSAGKRLFDYKNLLQIFFIAELASYGIHAPVIKNYLEDLKYGSPTVAFPAIEKYIEGDYSKLYCSLSKHAVVWSDIEHARAARALRGTGMVITDDPAPISIEGKLSALFVNLEELQRELDRRLTEEGWR